MEFQKVSLKTLSYEKFFSVDLSDVLSSTFPEESLIEEFGYEVSPTSQEEELNVSSRRCHVKSIQTNVSRL
jgi:hypothetical protein